MIEKCDYCGGIHETDAKSSGVFLIKSCPKVPFDQIFNAPLPVKNQEELLKIQQRINQVEDYLWIKIKDDFVNDYRRRLHGLERLAYVPAKNDE